MDATADDVRRHLTNAILAVPLNSSIMVKLLTNALRALSRGKLNEVQSTLLDVQAEGRRQNLWLDVGTSPLMQSVDAVRRVLRELMQQEEEKARLTPQEMEQILRRVQVQISLDPRGGVFVEKGFKGWFVGRNGYSLSEPDVLDKGGRWGILNDCYFSDPLAALQHAKLHGYLKFDGDK